MQTVVFTSDVGLPFIPGMLHQWGRYRGIVEGFQIVGFTPPEFNLPCPFISLGEFADYPAHKWSDGLLAMLNTLPEDDDLVLILLEDYWLTRDINIMAVYSVANYMAFRHDVLRACLTTDRLYGGNISRDLGSIRYIDIFESGPCPYQISMQASIWRKSLLRRIIEPGESPWQFEINGSERLSSDKKLQWMKVIGTRQWPMKYQIVCDKGRFRRWGGWMVPARQISTEDWAELESLSLIPNVPAWEEREMQK